MSCESLNVDIRDTHGYKIRHLVERAIGGVTSALAASAALRRVGGGRRCFERSSDEGGSSRRMHCDVSEDVFSLNYGIEEKES